MAGEALLIAGGLMAAIAGLVGTVWSVTVLKAAVLASSWATAGLCVAAGLASIIVAAVGATVHYMEVNECWQRLGPLLVWFKGADALIQQGSNPEAGTLIGEVILRGMRDANRMDRNALFLAAGVGPGMSVIELGCADGYLLLQLAEACAAKKPGTPTGRVLGVDVSAGAVRGANRRLLGLGTEGRVDALAVRADFAAEGRGTEPHLPAPDGSVDVVAHAHCVYFWPDLAAGAADIARVLRPGGTHCFVVAPAAHLAAQSSRPDSPFKNVNSSAWTAAFEAAGFEVDPPTDLPGKGRGQLWRMRKPLA